MQNDYITKLLGIQGFRVVKVELGREGERTKVTLDLERKSRGHLCSHCGQKVKKAIPYRARTVQHLTLWHHLTFLRFMQYRVLCPRCGLKVEALPFVCRYERITTSLGSLVYELCKVMTNKAAALFQYLDRGTVKRVDRAALQKAQAGRSLEGITALGVDEIGVGAGQHYWHLVSALDGPEDPELLYVGEGRKEQDLRKFWEWFGAERANKITVAVMDMWKGFIKSFKAHCPKSDIIYDKFHIIRHLLESLNEVRKQELKRAGTKLKGVLAGKKFILLSRQAHVRGKARQALNQLLSLSRRLFKAHLLKENFSHLWTYRSKTWARKFWIAWKDSLKWSRLKPYQTFAQLVDDHLDGILAFCDHKVPLGFMEGTNLKARNIIRRAYGYRDEEYMKLKIIQACSSLGTFQPWFFSFNNST
jgi:transposase